MALSLREISHHVDLWVRADVFELDADWCTMTPGHTVFYKLFTLLSPSANANT